MNIAPRMTHRAFVNNVVFERYNTTERKWVKTRNVVRHASRAASTFYMQRLLKTLTDTKCKIEDAFVEVINISSIIRSIK